jgi:hypothetical protein
MDNPNGQDQNPADSSVPTSTQTKANGNAYLTIELWYEGNTLPANNVKYVKVFNLADCSLCPQVPEQVSGQKSDSQTWATYQTPIRWNGVIALDAEGVDGAGKIIFPRTVVSVRCGESKTVPLYGQLAPEPKTQIEMATVVLQARVCGNSSDRRETMRTPEILSARAEAVPVKQTTTGKQSAKKGTALQTKQLPSVAATVDKERALFSLPKGSSYTFDVQVKEGHLRCSLGTPFQYTVSEEKEQIIPVYFEAAERVVALFTVGPDGHAASIPDLQVEKGRATSIVNHDGYSTLTGVEPGELKLKSSSFHLQPDRFHIDESMAQSHVIHASPRQAEAAKPNEEYEEIVLDLQKLLAEDEVAILRILTPEGKVIETFDAKRGDLVRYHAKSDQPLLIQASINGRLVDEVVHRPSAAR